jgi:Protein of unknown function (DUF3300)
MLRCRKVLLAAAIILMTPVIAAAQGTQPSQPASTPQTSPPPQTDETLLKPEQLDALVAPIALYPDALLANMLAASTYPLEVVEADRWVSGHKKLKGDQLKAEVGKQSWDDSVKALASTPSVLSMMSEKLDWTRSLGDAVLAQQPDVMDAVQRLRARAQANKKLSSTKQQKVSVQQQGSRQTIVIEPTDPDTMYVPYYEPSVVYGEWPYADYPPYYFGYPSYIGAGVVAAGLAFGAAYAIGRWGNYWGGGVNWGNNNFFINRSNSINNWQHNAAHRQGVRYNNASVQQRFGNNNLRAGNANRMDYRGRGGQQVLNPGTDRAKAGDRGGGDRAGAADRGRGDRGSGDRANARDRAGGDRQAKGDRGGAKGGAKQARAGNRGGGGGGAAGRGGRDNALRTQSGRAANLQSARGRASFASAGMPRGGGGGMRAAGGGGFRGGGGGGFRGGGGGGGGFRGGGGGRRSDLALKHDVVLLGHLDNGLGYYRFSYLGSDKAYVGVIAQEVAALRPDTVTRGRDGYLRVHYDKLGLKFRTYQDWLAAGARIPARAGI